MSQHIDAIFSDGVFRPQQPVHFADGEWVSLTIDTKNLAPVERDDSDDLSDIADLLDHEFMQECRRNFGNALPIEEIQRRMSVIKESLSDSIIEEREDRF